MSSATAESIPRTAVAARRPGSEERRPSGSQPAGRGSRATPLARPTRGPRSSVGAGESAGARAIPNTTPLTAPTSVAAATCARRHRDSLTAPLRRRRTPAPSPSRRTSAAAPAQADRRSAPAAALAQADRRSAPGWAPGSGRRSRAPGREPQAQAGRRPAPATRHARGCGAASGAGIVAHVDERQPCRRRGGRGARSRQLRAALGRRRRGLIAAARQERHQQRSHAGGDRQHPEPLAHSDGQLLGRFRPGKRHASRRAGARPSRIVMRTCFPMNPALVTRIVTRVRAGR